MFVSAHRFSRPDQIDEGDDAGGFAACEDFVGTETDAGVSADALDLTAESSLFEPARAPALTPKKAAVVNRALTQLADLAADPKRFCDVLAKAFGPDYDRDAGERLRKQILAGDTSWLPKIEFASREQLGGARGAYAAETGTVYINRDIRSPKRAAEVLLEEAGHHIDTLLNRRDAAGDEGEIFRRLVVGETLSDETLADLRAENDHGTMQIDGKRVAVENWSWSWWPFGGGGSSVPPVLRDLVKEAANNVVHYIEALPERIRSAAQGWVDALVANAKAFGEGLVKSMESVAGGLAKLGRGDLGGITDILNGLKNTALEGFHAFARLTMDTISAVQTALGLEPIGRRLRDDEIGELRKVFGDTVDYSKITIKEGKAGIFAGDRAITMGNTIYVKDDKSLSTLIHETTHVWQFQNGGNDYMLKAGWAQFNNWLHGNETEVAYDWTRDIGKGWAALNPEQQAQLIQDAGTGWPSYVQQLESWTKASAAYEAKEAAFRAKYPSTNRFEQIGNLLGGVSFGALRPAGVVALGSGRLGGRNDLGLDFGKLAARQALDAERTRLLADRPTLGRKGIDYTSQVDDALWRLRNRIGAP
jgi:hypothetical protein